MKNTAIIATLLAALFMASPMQSAQAQSGLTKVTQVLTSSNGISAGKALLSLYTNYKSAGKLDFSNPSNIQSLLSLAQNVKGLTTESNNAGFLSGLFSGSNNLVNQDNSLNVLSALTSIANLDTSSLTQSATNSVKKSLLSKLSGSENKQPSSSGTTDAASNILTGLFSAFN